MPRSRANCSCGGFSLETKNVRRRLCNSSGAGCIGLRSVLLAGAFDVTAAEVAPLRAHTARHGENPDPSGEVVGASTGLQLAGVLSSAGSPSAGRRLLHVAQNRLP